MKTALLIPAAALVAAPFAFAAATGLSAESATYSVIEPDNRWDVSLGHHRARVEVKTPASAVLAHLPWRLQLAGMERRDIIVIGPDGKRVNNTIRLTVSRESADIAFEATTAGTYAIHYLAYTPKWRWIGCHSQYTPYKETADKAWLLKNNLDAAKFAAGSSPLPKARLIDFQARSEFDRFDPMEVIATKAELDTFLARHPQPLLVFPEKREFPIRMKRDLPSRWVAADAPAGTLKVAAQQNEYYAFQLGLYAPTRAANKITTTVSALRGPDGAEIPASAIICYNLEGVDTHGRKFEKPMNIAAGAVQPLWFGIDIAPNQKPGLYTGEVRVAAQGAAATPVKIELRVNAGALADRGDAVASKMTRLRWMNSTAGLEETVTRPYTPLTVSASTIGCLGREVTLGDEGLPKLVSAGKRQVLAKPARFVVESETGELRFDGGKTAITSRNAARVAWESPAAAAEADMICRGEMEFDGHLRYKVELRAKRDIAVKDIRLELPYRAEAAEYRMGMGSWGGKRPEQSEWKWKGAYDSFWLGGVHAGLFCELRGGSYHGPMVNLYHPAQPPTWGNGGKGGVIVREVDGAVLASAYSGARKIKAGESVTFEFDLIVTPVKPLDTKSLFSNRYWHICPPEGDRRVAEPVDVVDPTPEALGAGVNVVNLHHSTPRNPYINSPFHTDDLIKPFVADMHNKGVKVKLYYTLRELSNYVTELPFLQSLGNEVIANGGGGGFAWLQEHMVSGYTPSWYSPFADGTADASFVTSGHSRWYNSYIEGLGWMIRNFDIDGLYLDDVSYDRHVLQRMRRVMDAQKPGCMIDLHSNTAFSNGPANQYLEFFPYIDRLWFGESFNYEKMTPDEWLVQTSGIPFGITGEMLADGGNPWRGALYGMTSRLGWLTNDIKSDPRPVWKVWNRFGITDATMHGYWESDCPVKTDNKDILATVYTKPGKALIAIASWAKNPEEVRLSIDWQRLGINPAKATLYAPHSGKFQKFGQWKPDATIPVQPRRGWLIVVDETGPRADDMGPTDSADALPGKTPVVTEKFAGPLSPEWTVRTSPVAGTALKSANGELKIEARTNVFAYATRRLPAGVTAVDCRIENKTDAGETFGPGLSLIWKNGSAVRINLRGREGRLSVDATGKEQIRAGRFEKTGTASLRLRLDAREIIAEAGTPEGDWERIASFPKSDFPGEPVAVRVGKSFGLEEEKDHTDHGTPGDTAVSLLRIYAK